jgi:serine protease AprX
MDSKLKLVITEADEELGQNEMLISTPNPFSEETTLHYKLKRPEIVSIQIYDLNGKQFRSLNSDHETTEGEFKLDGRQLTPGLYYCILRTKDGKSVTTKMLLQR